MAILMPDSFVIDGYNLIHALGMIQKHLDAGGLEASRRWLLDYLAELFGEDADRVTVVFDAKQAPRNLPRHQAYRGLHVHFAPKGQSADDWIETLIANEKTPAALVVVSNDHRLQDAGRKRGARAWSDQALLDFLEKRPRAPKTPTPNMEDRDGKMTPEEKKHWLEEFGMLESDPELREFFDLDRFD
jgi:predicted RNA-binding protein with PIN domain